AARPQAHLHRAGRGAVDDLRRSPRPLRPPRYAPMTGTMTGTLSIVGIGPGSQEHTTPAALAAIRDAELVVGYTTYIRLVKPLIEGKEIVKTGMTEEIGRARAAVERARDGARVAIISSG